MLGRKARTIRRLEAENEQLKQSVRRDPKTGLKNGVALREDLSDLVQEARRNGINSPETDITILYFDMSGFRQLNEAYGHDGADEVVKSVFEVISGTLRVPLALYRPHNEGDEGIILMPHLDLEMARRVAERIKLAISEIKLDKLPEYCFEMYTGYASLSESLEDLGLYESATDAQRGHRLDEMAISNTIAHYMISLSDERQEASKQLIKTQRREAEL